MADGMYGMVARWSMGVLPGWGTVYYLVVLRRHDRAIIIIIITLWFCAATGP